LTIELFVPLVISQIFEKNDKNDDNNAAPPMLLLDDAVARVAGS